MGLPGLVTMLRVVRVSGKPNMAANNRKWICNNVISQLVYTALRNYWRWSTVIGVLEMEVPQWGSGAETSRSWTQEVINYAGCHLFQMNSLRARGGSKKGFPFEMHLALTTWPCAAALASDLYELESRSIVCLICLIYVCSKNELWNT